MSLRHNFPMKIYATVSPEIYDLLQKYGISKIDFLINDLLNEYFEKHRDEFNEIKKEI